MPAARAEAEWLLADLLDCDRGALVLRRDDPLPDAAARDFGERVRRRERREPAQHITGRVGFHGVVLRCDRRALVPRPETEGLVDAVLGMGLPSGAVVVDLGTGGGCIPLALAAARSDLRLLALDASDDALALAADNAAALGLAGRVELRRADLAAPPSSWAGRADVVVSNPPYVREDEWSDLEPEVRDHDPRAALVAGPDGLEAYRALAPASRRLARPGGRLVLELGAGQAAAVRGIVEAAGFAVDDVRPDLAGIPRVLVATREPDGGTT